MTTPLKNQIEEIHTNMLMEFVNKRRSISDSKDSQKNAPIPSELSPNYHSIPIKNCLNCGQPKPANEYCGDCKTITDQATSQILKLISDEVIGEDTKHLNGKKMVKPAWECPECGEPNPEFIENNLRAEQRARSENKDSYKGQRQGESWQDWKKRERLENK